MELAIVGSVESLLVLHVSAMYFLAATGNELVQTYYWLVCFIYC